MPVQDCITRCLSFIEASLQWVQQTGNFTSAQENPMPGCLFIRHNNGFKKVTTEAINYLEASSSYCKFYLTSGTAMVVCVPLSDVAKHLPGDYFIRVHRSFSVNFLHVEGFTGNTLVMEGGIKLPIGRQYRESVIESLPLVGTKSHKYTV